MKLGDKEITIRELKRKDTKGKLTGLEGEDIQDALMSLATDLTVEELGELTFGDYAKLSMEFTAVNKLDGLEDFQKPQAS